MLAVTWSWGMQPILKFTCSTPAPFAYLTTVKNVGGVTIYTTGRITWNIERWEVHQYRASKGTTV